MAFALGALVLFAAGLYFGIELAKPPPPPDVARDLTLQSPPPLEPLRVPRQDPPPPSPSPPQPPPSSPPSLAPEPAVAGVRFEHPRIALVIDDLGRSLKDLDTLAGLGVPLTYSVLPYESLTSKVVAELRRRGEEILCHLPMEAKNGENPGPGALLDSMSREELAAATRRALAAVPGAAGANNHMGSMISSQRDDITAVLEVIAEHGLYYIDSRTTTETQGYAVARELGIPAGQRQVFLDNDRDPQAIRAQFQRLLEIARRHGAAIAIGHPYAETLATLQAEVPAAAGDGFHFVTASALLQPPAAPVRESVPVAETGAAEPSF